jgi:DNA (cytosine-5)-methyltransferase 1
MKMLDLFSGIGGFHEGFKRAGYQFDWVGFSEIDKYASAVYKYNYKESEELGDITTIRPERDLPDNIDILCGGFPCQAFSMAGKRLGFDDTRGTLFFEIARILTYYREKQRPIKCLVLENVKGLLSHDDGRTFATIYRVLDNLGYTIEFQLLNTRWWLPQNRERIYIVGYLGNRGGPQVFPIGEDGARNNEKRFPGKTTTGHKQGMLNSKDRRRRTMLRGSEKIEIVGNTKSGGDHSDMDLIKVGELKITAKKRIHDTPKEINEYLKANKNGKTIREIAESLDLPKTQVEHYFRSDKSRAIPSPDHWLLLKKLLGFDDTFDKEVTDIYEKEVEFESSRRVYSAEGISKTLDTHESGYYQIPEATKKGYAEAEVGDAINLSVPNSKTRRGRVGKGEAQTLDTGMQQYTIQSGIRRLTPVECMRLQGFSDDHNKYGEMDGKIVEISDTQRYKQAGNAVTVDVVQAVATIIKEKELL